MLGRRGKDTNCWLLRMLANPCYAPLFLRHFFSPTLHSTSVERRLTYRSRDVDFPEKMNNNPIGQGDHVTQWFFRSFPLGPPRYRND